MDSYREREPISKEDFCKKEAGEFSWKLACTEINNFPALFITSARQDPTRRTRCGAALDLLQQEDSELKDRLERAFTTFHDNSLGWLDSSARADVEKLLEDLHAAYLIMRTVVSDDDLFI